MKASNQHSSRKSPATPCFNPRKSPSSSYQHMFLEDFCQWFSIDLAKDKDDRPFYSISPENAKLEKLLTSQSYNFLWNGMDKLLSHVMRTLIFSGKAFIEVVLSLDKESNINGISLVPFDPVMAIPGYSNTYFIAIQCEGKRKFFKICNRNIVLFRLSDLGFRRYSLRRVYNKLAKFDILSIGDMGLSSKKAGFDISVWNNKREYQLLKLSKETGWYGRSTDNPYMGDAYILYRAIQRKALRRRFLDYFLKQINGAVSVICKELGIEGTIIARSISTNYDEILQKLHSGDINYNQVGDCIFHNKDILP